MAARTQPFFTNQSRLLDEGRIGAMARFYAVPLPVFLPRDGHWHLLQSRAAIVEAFWEKYRMLRTAGVGRLRACVTREASAGPERVQAEVTWFYVGAGGRRLGRTSLRYFLSRSPAGVQVDMMAFHRIAFPQFHDWFAVNATRIVGEPPTPR